MHSQGKKEDDDTNDDDTLTQPRARDSLRLSASVLPTHATGSKSNSQEFLGPIIEC